MSELYQMIFKRKSFRRFQHNLSISETEIHLIKNQIANLMPLINDIKVQTKIVKREQTTCKRGEYCLLIYSEEKANYLLNIGYMFEQLDLFLASINIGACWYGMGKVPEDLHDNNMRYVIMLAFGKGNKDEFRKDYTKAKRKETTDIWMGENPMGIADIVKYAPSACNSQPWRVICDNNKIRVFRATDIKSIMPKDKIPFYNSIDMGIFLFFLELTLSHTKIAFERYLCGSDIIQDMTPIAEYNLKV